MAVLSNELVLQRAGNTAVSVQASHATNANAEVLWSATTTLPNTVVVNKTVAANQASRDDIDARLKAAPTWTPPATTTPV